MPLRSPGPYWQTSDRDTVRLYCGDALKVLRRLPSGVVHAIVTSPPYYGLRDYQTGEWEGGDPECPHIPTDKWLHSQTNQCSGPSGGPGGSNATQKAAAVRRWYRSDGSCRCGARRIDQQLGSEPTPDCGTKGQAQCGECYVCKLTAVFRECRRVLRDDGTFWLNIGDSYASGEVGRKDDGRLERDQHKWNRPMEDQADRSERAHKVNTGLPSGNLLGMPWRLAFALQADGWVLRQDIIWAKPSSMPESVQNRCTKSHEYIFLLAKGSGYYYDAEAVKEKSVTTNMGMGKRDRVADANPQHGSRWNFDHIPENRNKRSVWSVQEDRQLYDWMAEHAPEVLAEFLARNETRGEEHEYIFLLAKQRAYYYDQEAIKEKALRAGDIPGGNKKIDSSRNDHGRDMQIPVSENRNKRSVWTVSHGGGYKGSHFASFPGKLIEPCILAGTSEVGCCPGCGAPWVRVLGKTRTITRPGTDSKVNAAAKAAARDKLPAEEPGRARGPDRFKASTLGSLVGNRDPERHVTETRTLGWRPGCECYGLELIGEQPSEPQQGKKEPIEAFEGRYRRYEHALAEWTAAWTRLKPLYEEALGDDGEGNYAGTVPCLVLDPFIGSGTTALVCLDKGRRCWGIDLREEYLREHCIQRVRSDLLGRPGLRHLAAPIPGGK